MMTDPFASIVDAFDIETFMLCETKEEGKSLMLDFLRRLGFEDIDVVSNDFRGFGSRLRARVYVNRPGADYTWLQEPVNQKGGNTE